MSQSRFDGRATGNLIIGLLGEAFKELLDDPQPPQPQPPQPQPPQPQPPQPQQPWVMVDAYGNVVPQPRQSPSANHPDITTTVHPPGTHIPQPPAPPKLPRGIEIALMTDRAMQAGLSNQDKIDLASVFDRLNKQPLTISATAMLVAVLRAYMIRGYDCDSEQVDYLADKALETLDGMMSYLEQSSVPPAQSTSGPAGA